MTIATVCDDASDRVGIYSPTSYNGAQNPSSRLLLRLCKAAAVDISRRHPWMDLRKVHVFTTVAGENQTGGIPADFDRMIKDTFWNRTDQRPVVGPTSSLDWQYMQATTLGSVLDDRFRIIGGVMQVYPAAEADETWAYEYQDKNLFEASDGTLKTDITSDADMFRLNEELLTRALTWRYRQSKGMDYAEDFSQFEVFLKQLQAQETAAGTINLDACGAKPRLPYPSVPEGDWNL